MTSIADLGRPEWELGRADFRFANKRTSIDAEALNERDVFHYSIPVVQEFGTGRIESGDTIDSSKLLIQSPVVLVSKLNPRKSTVCLAEPHAEALTVASGEFVPLDPVQDDIRYIYYVWSSELMRQHLSALVKSVTKSHQRCNPADIVKVPWRWPSKLQQEAIAHYLDHRCGEIDALIAKKRGLLGLLAEKRSALITRAVTKGLDPTAPMKPSGIDWLGDIPAHWDASFRLKFLTTVSGGLTPATANADYWRGDIPWVSPKDMKVFDIADSEDHVTELALEETSLSLIDPGAVLFVVRGMILAHTFPIAVNSVAITVNQDMKALRCGDRLTPKLLAYFLRGIDRHILSLVDTSAHGTKALRSESWRELNVPLPPLDEQSTILSKIDDGLAEIDKSAALIRSAIDQLTEYRAAIITKAVTGELEVT